MGSLPIIDWVTWWMVFLRISAFFSIFPLFSMPQVPVRLRIALGVLTAFLLAPGTAPLPVPPSSVFGLIGYMASEVLVGILLGFLVRLFYFLLEFAGTVIASEMGLNWSAMVNPFTNARSDVPQVALFWVGTLLFFSLDLHHWMLLGLQRIYTVLPIGRATLTPALFTEIVGRTGQIFPIAFLIAAPVIAVTFLINLVFSVVARAVPQMNVFSESFAFRIMAGMTVFGLTLTLMAQHASNYLRRLPDDAVRVASLLAGA